LPLTFLSAAIGCLHVSCFCKGAAHGAAGQRAGQFIGWGFIALIVVFQQEVRRFLIMLGTNSILTRNTYTRQLLPWNWQFQKNRGLDVGAVVKAAGKCRRRRREPLLYSKIL
jgi:hypothetical protein